MILSFSKFKLTNGIFFKRIEHAHVTVYEDKFEVSIYPYLGYSGKYYIHSIEKKGSYETVYRTALASSKEEKVPDIYPGINEYFISISRDRNLLMIYDGSLRGIILKQ